MIVHIALFRWKNGTPQNKINKVIKNIRQLKNKCNGVIDIMAGKNFSRYSEGFTHAIVVIGKNRTALKTYRNHPEHLRIAKEIDKMEEHGVGIDFEY